MHFRFFIFILFSTLICQAQLNRAIGENLVFGSARSYAMGITHSSNSNNSSLTHYNPSLLKQSLNNNNSIIDFQLNLAAISERRSILVKDYFGDFLTYGDYVYNSNIYNYIQGGFISNITNSIAVGLSYLPLCTFNYDYLEEVRGSADIDDGEVGLKDPLEGYHKFNSSGSLKMFSLGLSYTHIIKKSNTLNIGIGFNKILNAKIIDEYSVDSLTTDFENLSLSEDYSSEVVLNNLGNFYSLGISFINKEFLMSFTVEPGLLIEKDNYYSYNFIDSLGIISYLDSSNDNNFIDSLGVNYYKPEKLNFGFSYTPHSNPDLTITSEIEYNKLHKVPYAINSQYIYKFGFEYILPSDIPVRAGLSYKTSPINSLPDQAILTCGSGGSYKQLSYDIGLSYTFFDYYYPTLFVVNDDDLDNFDKITDSKLNIILGIKYFIK